LVDHSQKVAKSAKTINYKLLYECERMAAFIVGLAQTKGGVGKSTLAVQLAAAFSEQGRSSRIVDIDKQGTLTSWAALRHQLSFAAGHDIDVEQGSGWRLPYITERLSRDCDLIFIDGGSGQDGDFSAMTKVADLLLIPCQPTGLDLWATKGLLAKNTGLRDKALVVLNRMPPRGNAAALIRHEIEKLSWPMARQHIGNRQAFAATMGMGLSVAEVAPSSIAAREIDGLAKEILGRVSNLPLVA
jgi:chromosome partitioning protein